MLSPNLCYALPRLNKPIPNLVEPSKLGHALELTVESGTHESIEGKPAKTYGYSGQIPGPTIRVRRGDMIQVTVENRLDCVTTTHWHGLLVCHRLAFQHPGPTRSLRSSWWNCLLAATSWSVFLLCRPPDYRMLRWRSSPVGYGHRRRRAHPECNAARRLRGLGAYAATRRCVNGNAWMSAMQRFLTSAATSIRACIDGWEWPPHPSKRTRSEYTMGTLD
jgi:hypothetical protein